MEWATPQNLVLLLGIKETAVRVMLSDMLRTKNQQIRLKKVQNMGGHSSYYLASNKNGGTVRRNNIFYHDVAVRNIAAAMIQQVGYEYIKYLNDKDFKLHGNPDFWIGGIYMELDTGKFTLKQLEEKIRNNYSHNGCYLAFFIMQNEDGLKHLENNRVEIVFQAARNVLRGKKGRIIASGYRGYLEDREILRNVN